MMEKNEVLRTMLSGKPVLLRWPIYYALILFIIFFGEYNDHVFFYFQF